MAMSQANQLMAREKSFKELDTIFDQKAAMSFNLRSNKELNSFTSQS